MPAARYDITVEQGATFELPLSLQSESSSVDPTLVPMDLSGYTGRAQIRELYHATNVLTDLLVEFSSYSGSGELVGTSASSGSIMLSLTAAQTARIPAVRAVWDLKIYLGATEIRVLEGDAWIRPSVTRP